MNERSDGNGISRWRIEQIERRLANGRDPALLRQRIDELERDMNHFTQEARSEFKSIRRGLWVAASTFAVLAAGIFTLIVQQT